jgi:hypothetical protein
MDPTCDDPAWQKENYSWKLDKNDNALDEPVEEQDDACDMERYAMATVHLKECHVFQGADRLGSPGSSC